MVNVTTGDPMESENKQKAKVRRERKISST